MGWLTESALLPKKKRKIEGISTSSMVELKSVVYQSEQDTRRSKTFNDAGVRKTSKNINDVIGKNTGVAGRDERDRLEEAKAAGVDVQTALEAKSRIYEKIARGEIEDVNGRFLVDFGRKQQENEGLLDSYEHNPELLSEDMQREHERIQWEKEASSATEEDLSSQDPKKLERLLLLEQLTEQTKAARGKHEDVLKKRQEAAALRIAKLKDKSKAGNSRQRLVLFGKG